MKKILKFILKYYLKYIVKFILFINKPLVIVVTGSVNKHFAKEEIGKMFTSENIQFLSSDKSFNTEIGLPLSILSLQSGYNYYKKWLPAIFKAPMAIFKKLPKVLLLEFGISDPGDMKYLISIVRPKIAIITDITRRYLEGFDNMDNLAEEYEYLLRELKQEDLAVLNFDNSKIKKMKKSTRARIAFFGINEGADWQATQISTDKQGQKFKVLHDNFVSNFNIPKFGTHHIYALLIGQAVKNHYASQHKK